MADEKSKTQSIVEGTIAQALGGSFASVLVLTLASFNHYLAAGLESSLGTFLGIVAYIAFKGLRK